MMFPKFILELFHDFHFILPMLMPVALGGYRVRLNLRLRPKSCVVVG